jgi:hypothetical protein
MVSAESGTSGTSSVQKRSTRAGYTLLISVVGRLEDVPILKEIYNHTNMIAAKEVEKGKGSFCLN